MPDQESSPQRAAIIEALKESWAQSSGARQYKLAYFADRIRKHDTGWVVPVALGESSGSGRGLTDALNELQDQVEERTHFIVTLFLDPDLESPTTNN